MKGANYVIINDVDDVLTIRDLGPWDRYMTVTNAAELVVSELQGRNVLTPTKKIVCFDSDNEPGLLLHDGKGNFLGFASIPQEVTTQLKLKGDKET